MQAGRAGRHEALATVEVSVHRFIAMGVRLSAFVGAMLCLALAARAETVVGTMGDVQGQALAVNGGGMETYVANAAGDYVSMVDQTSGVRKVAVGRTPRFITFGNNFIYTSNAGDGTVSVIRAGGTSASSIAVGGSGPIISDGGTKAYLIRQEQRDLAVVDAASFASHAIDAGGRVSTALALDFGKRLYVSQPDVGMVRAIDISSDSSQPPAVDIPVGGRPGPLSFNAANGKLYVLTGDASRPLVEVDAATNATRVIGLAGHGANPRAIATDVGRVFMGFANEFVILDLTTGNVRAYASGNVVDVYANSLSGNAYALDADGMLFSYNRFQQRVTTIPVGGPAYDVAFIYKTSMVFATTASGLVRVASPAGDIGITVNAQGLWWVPNGTESGWGINLTHQDDVIFATWFTYDAQGRPTWLVMSDGREGSRNEYSGTLYRTTGPPFNAVPFDPSKVTRTAVGTLTINTIDFENAMLTATVDGVTVKKPLGKQIFAAPEPYCTWSSSSSIPNYTDLWWAVPAGSESGWGLNVAHQGDILFITWFTYDGSGQPMWYVGSDLRKTGNGTYSGQLYQTAGPPLTASPWDPSFVSRTPVGNATLTFSDDSNGTFSYSVGLATQSKAITRQVYGRSTTRCQ
jgi:hypothetical protein